MKCSKLILLFILSFCTFAIDQIDLSNKFLQSEFYRNNYKYIYGNNEISNLRLFKKRVESLKKNKKEDVDLLVRKLSDHIPSELLRPIIYWKTISPNKEHLIQAITFTMLYKANVLRDNYLSPTNTKENSEDILSFMSKVYLRDKFDVNNLYATLFKDFHQKAVIISKFKDINNFITSIKETNSLSLPLPPDLPIDPYTLSFTGYIPGNQVSIYNRNSLDPFQIRKFIDKNQTDSINLEENPTYSKIKELIKNAKSSIFISTKHIDGKIGQIFIELLLAKIVNNSVLTIHLLYCEESQVLKELYTKVNANDELKSKFFLMKSPHSQSFNTKVIVIDANTKSPEALIGTKNLSDHNGGYFFDNSIWVKGPAAAVIQNSFYPDIALSLEQYEYKDDYKENTLVNFKITQKNYPLIGNQVVRIIENDINQIVKSTRNSIIDMIKKADSYIYMEQLYFYDTYITNALIKRKLEQPELDIKIIIDKNENIDLNGLPNSIFLRELALYRIPVKSRVSVLVKNDSPTGNHQVYRQENHRNTISIDGKVLLTSSASLSPDHLDGHSREMGLQIYDKGSIQRFEKQFLLSWTNRTKVINLDIENFQIKTEKSTFSKELSSLINAIASSLMKAKEELKSKF